MKFLSRSLVLLLALYGLVFAIGDMYLARSGAPLWSAVVFAVGLIAIQFAIGPWVIERILDIFWDDAKTQLPARNWEFIEELCRQRGLDVPRVGVIQSGTPNAFSFGHTPGDARVVVTSGLLDVLTTEEANAVLAHELGHVEHWDFVVMTIAALAPLLLYQIYVFARNVSNFRAIAYSAYLCYWVGQYIVLLLNRTREYFADHYSAEVTQAPDQLASALVKIAYGMVRAEGEIQQELHDASRKEKAALHARQRLSGTIAVMGISNLRSGAALALGQANPSEAAAVMRWDLVNPWARVYEMNSTHPLTALRVRELNHEASVMGKAVQYPLPEDRRIRWGRFPLELFLWAAPWIIATLLLGGFLLDYWLEVRGIAVPTSIKPFLLVFGGVIWLTRTLYRYHGEFDDAAIGSLLEDVDVSEMRPRPVRLRGEILGRGVPGAFWSADLVVRDATGILFVLYRQSIPLARFLFAITEAEGYIGQQVTIEGWFRRGMTPYVEMSSIQGEYSPIHRAYSRWIQMAGALAAIIGGLLWYMS